MRHLGQRKGGTRPMRHLGTRPMRHLTARDGWDLARAIPRDTTRPVLHILENKIENFKWTTGVGDCAIIFRRFLYA